MALYKLLISSEMPVQNYSLLMSSYNMLQDYKEHLPLTAAYHKEIFNLKSIEIPNFDKPGTVRTYQGKDKTNNKVDIYWVLF